MSEKDNSVHSILGRLDDRRADELRTKMKEIEFRKDDYMRLWLEQHEQFRAHNEKFGTNLKGIHPTEMPQYLDRELDAEAARLERELKEELEERQLELPEQVANDNEKIPPRFGFLDQKDEVTRNPDFEESKELKELKKELGPLRFGFLEQKEDLTINHEFEDKEMSNEFEEHQTDKSMEDPEPDYYEEY